MAALLNQKRRVPMNRRLGCPSLPAGLRMLRHRILHHRNARYRVLPGPVTGHSAAVSDALPGTPIGILLDPPSSPLRHPVDDETDAGIALSPPADGDHERQARASLWPGGTAAAIAATRMKAVAPTATAPMIENTICQGSEGMVCFTMP